MKHKSFVVTSTVVMFILIGVVAGLALYSSMVVSASIRDLPESIAYLPKDSQAVFGMNVKSFIASPAYATFQQKHGDQVGKDLADFIAQTGVDPRNDISYVIASGRSLEGKKGTGVVIAQGNFNTAAITTFINSKAAPIKLDYNGATVLIIPEANGSTVEKGIAFLSEQEIALGEIGMLKEVLDIKASQNSQNRKESVLDNTTLRPLLDQLDSNQMFWFAGDPTNVLAKAPANTPLGGNITAITNVFGTLNLTTEVVGTITVTAKDEVSAGKLADVAKGLLALGSLASDQNPNLAELLKGVMIQQSKTQIQMKINFPVDLLDKLEQMKKPAAVTKKVA